MPGHETTEAAPAGPSPRGGPGAADDGFEDLGMEWLRARPGEKWSAARRAGPDVLACWVADMDFPAPAPVRQALEHLARVGDLGYAPEGAAEALEPSWVDRMKARFDWAPPTGRLRVFTDVVQAVQAVLHVCTAPGDGVFLLTPSYPPFVHDVGSFGRRLLPVPAVDDGARWRFDFASAGTAAVGTAAVGTAAAGTAAAGTAATGTAAAAGCKAILLVNPHNPTGHMLTIDELRAVDALAQQHDLIVISDEVHSDLTLTNARHIPFASISPSAQARTVTVYSASKAYNLGGMRCAVAHVGDDRVAAEFATLPSRLLGEVGLAGVVATQAAWSPKGNVWLDDVLGRLRANRQKVAEWLQGPAAALGVRGHPPEAGYLCWLDFRATSIRDAPGGPAHALLETGRVMLSDGAGFGPGGDGFARVNFATTSAILDEILERILATLRQ